MSNLNWPYSLVILTPKEHEDCAEALMHELGYSGKNFVACFSSNGEAPETHLGLQTLAKSGVDLQISGLPGLDGFSEQEFLDFINSSIIDLSTELSGLEHVESVLTSNNLQLIVHEE